MLNNLTKWYTYDCPIFLFVVANIISVVLAYRDAHKNPVFFAEWLRTHKPEQYQYVLEHYNDKANLDDRNILEEIELGLIDELNQLNVVTK